MARAAAAAGRTNTSHTHAETRWLLDGARRRRAPCAQPSPILCDCRTCTRSHLPCLPCCSAQSCTSAAARAAAVHVAGYAPDGTTGTRDRHWPAARSYSCIRAHCNLRSSIRQSHSVAQRGSRDVHGRCGRRRRRASRARPHSRGGRAGAARAGAAAGAKAAVAMTGESAVAARAAAVRVAVAVVEEG